MLESFPENKQLTNWKRRQACQSKQVFRRGKQAIKRTFENQRMWIRTVKRNSPQDGDRTLRPAKISASVHREGSAMRRHCAGDN